MKKLLLVLVVVCVLVGTTFGQASPSLKEHAYPSEGFAIKSPTAPEAHTDASDPNVKIWTIQLSEGGGISIKRRKISQPCDAAVEMFKSEAKAQNLQIKEFSQGGRMVWQQKEHRRGDAMIEDRLMCDTGHLFIITYAWPASVTRPQAGTQIIDSFRLIK